MSKHFYIPERAFSRPITFALLFLFLAIPFFSMAQKTVTGKVISNKDESPLAGISILIKGTKTGTSSGVDGSFAIAAKSGDVLIFSGVNIRLQEVPVGTDQTLNITVEQTSESMNEVVVTALGIKKEVKRLGYAVQEVKGEDLLKARESNPINGLAGKVAGLNVGINQELLAAPTVLLRGNNVTLYVVDGIPINSDTWNLSPDDIETYTVLKGPAAAALYGNRGINGAILITTKRGKKNAKGFSVEFNSSVQMNKGFIAIPKVQSEYGGGDYQTVAFGDGNGAGRNDADYDVWGPKLDGRLLPQYDGKYDPTKTYTTTFADGSKYTGHIEPTPWTARGKDNLENFLQAGLITTNNLSFSAVGDRSNIRMSVTNSYQRGITPNTQLNTINFNLFAGYDVSSKVRLEANVNYNRQFTPNTPDVTYGPNSIIYNIDIWTGADWNINDMKDYWQPGKEGIQSKFVEYKRYHNPYFMSYEWLRGHYKNDIYAWTSINYKINRNFDAMLRTNVTTYDMFRDEKLPFSTHPYGEEHGRGNYREDVRSMWENNTEVLVKYNNDIGQTGLNLSAFAGGNMRNFRYSSSFTTTNQLIVPNVYNFGNSLNPIRSFDFKSNMLVLSAYYSVDLTYKKYFTVSTTGRVDKSSALLTAHNSGFYPSVSLSSVLSDYVTMPRGISFLKVRANYANVKEGGTSPYIGTVPIGTYPIGYGGYYYSTYGGPTYEFTTPYSVGPEYNNVTSAATPSLVVDPNIKPASRTNKEAGIDMRFLGNRLSLSATYFEYINGPQQYSSPLSTATGISTYRFNAVKTKRTGGEISLQGTPVQSRGLRWDVIVNWATYKEIFTELPDGVPVLNTFFHVGDRVDKLYGKYEMLAPDGKVIHDASGLPRYLPVSQYLGNSDPDWSWAVINKFSYKDFTFSFQFDGLVGGKIQDYVKRKLYEGGRGQNTVEGAIGAARSYESDHWGDAGYKGAINPATGAPFLGGDGVQIASGVPQFDANGQITNMKDLTFKPNKTATNWVQDYVSSFFNDPQHTMVSKTYAKLREVVITYTLPNKILPNKFISRVSVSLVGRNLLYFFPKEFHDIDVDQYPGRDIFNNSAREYNLQSPTTRSYGFNLNVTF